MVCAISDHIHVSLYLLNPTPQGRTSDNLNRKTIQSNIPTIKSIIVQYRYYNTRCNPWILLFLPVQGYLPNAGKKAGKILGQKEYISMPLGPHQARPNT